jgi:AraC-like DNA-binding protein
MDIQFNIVILINSIGLVLGLFFTAIILGLKKGKKETKYILAALIFVFSLLILVQIFNNTNFYFQCPHFLRIFPQFYLTLGPLFFLYVKALTTKQFRFRRRYWLHFLPFILQILYNIHFYIKSSGYKLIWYEGFQVLPDLEFHIKLVFWLFHLTFYLVLTARQLNIHNKEIKNLFSSLANRKLTWIWYLIIALASFIIDWMLYSILRLFFSEVYFQVRKYILIWEPLVITLLGYKGLTQSDIFSGQEPESVLKKDKQLLLNEKADKVLKQLLDYMEDEKPYLDSDLSLGNLANKIGIPPRYLSQIINQKKHQNFHDFVNQYRVNKAKQLLLDPNFQKYTILAAAFEAGFNSKSTFNLIFKKFEKVTPSQFLKQYKNKPFQS